MFSQSNRLPDIFFICSCPKFIAIILGEILYVRCNKNELRRFNSSWREVTGNNYVISLCLSRAVQRYAYLIFKLKTKESETWSGNGNANSSIFSSLPIGWLLVVACHCQLQTTVFLLRFTLCLWVFRWKTENNFLVSVHNFPISAMDTNSSELSLSK